ncbi:MAG: signal peptide peptidase SppA [Myxococcota bacterium]
MGYSPRSMPSSDAHEPVDPAAAPPPRRSRRPRESRGPSTGLVLVMLLLGSLMGATCVTCATVSDYDTGSLFAHGDRVGVVEIFGTIEESKTAVDTIRQFAQREDIVAIVVHINSGGGGVAPSQAIYRALREASGAKPVVASMASMAASGGFWIALGADWVFAESGTLTGSIGVIIETPDLNGIADALRFKMRTYKSGRFKDMGNPFRPATPADEERFQVLIDDIYDQFLTLTAERRGQLKDEVRKVADGRLLTGRAALEADLIDELGGLHMAAKKAVLLAQARVNDAVQTSSVAYKRTDDPILVYPPEPAPSLAEMLGVSIGQAIRSGVADGVRSELELPSSSRLKVR